MKILMTADAVGGVWTYALELALALQQHGAHVVLATMGTPLRESHRADVASMRNLTLRESQYKLEWMDDAWSDVERAGAWLLELERVERPDVVHLNGYVHAALSWQSPVLAVGHSCVRSWWEAVRREPVPAKWDEYTRRVTAGLRAADAVVAPSRAMLDALHRHYGPLGNAQVVHNGRGGAFRQREKSPYVMTVGRLWDEAKNVTALTRVADALPWPVYVAGSIESPAGDVATLGALQPLGQLSHLELAEWLSRASIFALPARYEPFGLGVLEAARSGCALVLGDVPSLRELWGDAAIYVDPDDDEALISAIEQLSDDDAMRNALAVRALNQSFAFTPASMMARYWELYQRLLRDRRGRMMEIACAS